MSDSAPAPPAPADPRGKELRALMLAALGVVYGDIGTSPLYALKESFHSSHGLPPTAENVLGILSLVFWSLTLVVAVKYLVFIVRADNRGEGGIMALLALTLTRLRDQGETTRSRVAILLGLFGAALLYGDGVITPAISVLSAVEGLRVATPAAEPFVLPITIAILVGLFLVQRRGTAQIGAVFGRLMLVWFAALAVIGLPWILERPDVLAALDPRHAVAFFARNGVHGYLVLGAVVLCITGGEALYADMGHFGVRPIRRGWFRIVFPALLVNYFGQGALVLARGPEVLENPFFRLVEGDHLLYPLVALATAATVIASQALISGAFSLTQQAVQLGYLPRLAIRHTSRETEGQIYVPRVNLLLMVACVALVLAFPHSSELAAAYGIAVTGTMVITTLLFHVVAYRIWGWPLWRALTLTGAFLAVDLAFFSANLVKLADGGWVPVALGFALLAVMTTWKAGRKALARQLTATATPLGAYIEELARRRVARVPGTAVFMTLTQDVAPSVLQHYVRHSHALHERVLLLSIVTDHTPSVPASRRVRATDLPGGFTKIVACYGYMESPNIAEVLMEASACGVRHDPSQLSFYLGRETILPNGSSTMWGWRKRLFIFISRNARPATEYFNLPPDQVIEIGAQVSI